MINPTSSDFRLFWTAYDPLDLASGSIDVLGFQTGYVALANKLLPGFTTVTTSPRYVSMLCAAVRAAEAVFPGPEDSTVRIRKTRHGSSEVLRASVGTGLWACCHRDCNREQGGRWTAGPLSPSPSDRTIRSREWIRTSSFNLLANQVRYGGIGAYSTLLEDCHLASMRSITPRPLGTMLAKSFPQHEDDITPWDEDRPLPLDALRAWGEKCHLGDFTRDEGQCLANALRGGEEGGWEDDVRWTSLRLLANLGEDGGRGARLAQSTAGRHKRWRI